jgi:hypothetical protein
MAQRWIGALFRGNRRRERQRLDRYFDCTWLSPWGEEKARVSSLSPNGCYIQSRFSVPPAGAVLRELTIALPTEKLNLQGTVIDAMSGVGFAVRFIDLDAKTRQSLNILVHGARR